MEVIRDMVEVNGMVGRVPREAEVLCTSPNRVKIVLGASEMHAVALLQVQPWPRGARPRSAMVTHQQHRTGMSISV